MTGVPIFTHTMVAFAATFLLKMAKTWGGIQVASPDWPTEPVGLGLNFNIGQVLSLSRRSADLLSRVAESLNEKHLTRNIVHGIKELLKYFDNARTPESMNTPAVPPMGVNGARMYDTSYEMHSVDPAVDIANGYNMYDLIGSYGFGFDESFLGQAASGQFGLWPTS